MDKLTVQKADLVTHDIGNMVGYALAAQYPTRITRWAASMRHSRALARGMKFLRAPCCGISTFAVRIWTGW
jgi:pimeloyl-ACP methyl ester carboxylesterase